MNIETAHIIGTKVVEEVVHFVISVSTAEKEWCTVKRYSNFEVFHDLLLTIIDVSELPVGCVLPGKRFKIWYNHSDRDFVEERTLLLDHYLTRVIQLSGTHSAVADLLLGFLSTDAIVIELPTHIPIKQRLATHAFPEDAEVTDIQINATRVVNDHVLYQVDCANSFRESGEEGHEWTVLKRFQQFLDLDQVLRASLSHRPEVVSQFFPLERHFKIFQDHLDPHFIEHRRILLQNYIQTLLLQEPVTMNEHFLNFIGIS